MYKHTLLLTRHTAVHTEQIDKHHISSQCLWDRRRVEGQWMNRHFLVCPDLFNCGCFWILSLRPIFRHLRSECRAPMTQDDPPTPTPCRCFPISYLLTGSCVRGLELLLHKYTLGRKIKWIWLLGVFCSDQPRVS